MMIKPLLVFICASFPLSASANELLTFEGSLLIDYSFIQGADNDNITRGLASLGGEIDLSDYLGENSHFSFGYAAQNGKNGSEYAMDIQAFSNIDEDDFSRWYEVFFQFSPVKDGTLKIGQLDVNSDFAASQYAGEFINSSMGFSPTIYALPTYPQPVYGFSFSYLVNDSFDWAVGIFDGTGSADHFEETFSIVQLNWHLVKTFTTRLGGWYQSGDSGDSSIEGQTELFAIVDYHWSKDLAAFVQLGSASKQYSQINKHFGVGIQAQDLFSPASTAGIGLSQVNVTNASNELAIELFYAFSINQWLRLKLDYQHINTPAGDETIKNANIATLRTAFSF